MAKRKTPEYGKALPGVDYVLKGSIPSMYSKRRFAYDDLVHVELSISMGHTDIKCRCCRRGWPELPYLLKYAVRHYVCEDCANYYAESATPRPTKSELSELSELFDRLRSG